MLARVAHCLLLILCLFLAGCAAPASTVDAPTPSTATPGAPDAATPTPPDAGAGEAAASFPFLRADTPAPERDDTSEAFLDPHDDNPSGDDPDAPPVLRSGGSSELTLQLRPLARTEPSSGDEPSKPLSFVSSDGGGVARSVRESGAVEWIAYHDDRRGAPYEPFVAPPGPGNSARTFVLSAEDYVTVGGKGLDLAMTVDPDAEIRVTKCDDRWYVSWWGAVPKEWRCDQDVPNQVTRIGYEIALDGGKRTLTHNWQPGWIRIVPFTLGSEQFLFEQKADGTVVIDRVHLKPGEENWVGLAEVYRAKWNPKWDQFAFYNTENVVYILSYASSTGDAAVDKLVAVPNVGYGFASVWSAKWSAGWRLAPISGGAGDTYAACNDDGRCVVDRFEFDGKITTIARGAVDLSFADTRTTLGAFDPPSPGTASFAVRRGAEWLEIVVVPPGVDIPAAGQDLRDVKPKVHPANRSSASYRETLIASSAHGAKPTGPAQWRFAGDTWQGYAPARGGRTEMFALKEGRPGYALSLQASALGPESNNPFVDLERHPTLPYSVTVDPIRPTGQHSTTIAGKDFLSPENWEDGWDTFVANLPKQFALAEVERPFAHFAHPVTIYDTAREGVETGEVPVTTERSADETDDIFARQARDAEQVFEAAAAAWPQIVRDPKVSETTRVSYIDERGVGRGGIDLEVGYFRHARIAPDLLLLQRLDRVTVVLREAEMHVAGHTVVVLSEVYRVQWATDWSDFLPVIIDGQRHLFSYDTLSGQAALDRIVMRGSGSGGETVEFEPVWTTQFERGWTGFGGQGREFVACNALRGECAVISIGSSGPEVFDPAVMDMKRYTPGTLGPAPNGAFAVIGHADGGWRTIAHVRR